MADKDIIKTLCNERFNELFSDKISNEQKEIVISAFFDIIVMIYDKFDITITKDNYVLSNNDYYEVLMLLFPFIDDWNKLKEVEDLEDNVDWYTLKTLGGEGKGRIERGQYGAEEGS